MATIYNDPKHGAIIKKAGEFLSAGAMVCAICGATAALANAGLLDQRPHTSNRALFEKSPGVQFRRNIAQLPVRQGVKDVNYIPA